MSDFGRTIRQPNAKVPQRRATGLEERKMTKSQFSANNDEFDEDASNMGFPTRGKKLDVKELLKKEMFLSKSRACDDHFEKSRPCPDGVKGVADSLIMFDSFEKTEESDPAKGIFKFNLMVQGVTRDQAIGIKDKIETIIEMQMGPFTIPLLSAVAYTLNDPVTNTGLPRLIANGAPPTDGALGVPLTQLPFSDKITILVKEMDSQCYISRLNTKYHFEMDCKLRVPQGGGTADRIDLTPATHGWDTYVFTDPIKSGDGFTFVFRNPDKEVKFPPDCLYGITAQTNAAQLLQFNAVGHGLVAGDRFNVKGFTSGNSIIDNYVKRLDGLIVGAGGLTANTFRPNPDVDLTPLGLPINTQIVPPAAAPMTDNTTPVPPSTRIDILIAKNRVRIPMRVRGVVERLTNYMQA